MSGLPIELTTEECLARLSAGGVGRIGFNTPGGLRIVPLNYSVVDGAIVVRTSSYSELGTYAPDAGVAFEIDAIDEATRSGWSVLASGRLSRVTDAEEVQRIRLGRDPEPWAEGARHLYLRLAWRELTGRRLGAVGARGADAVARVV